MKTEFVAAKKNAVLHLYKLDIAKYEWQGPNDGVTMGPYINTYLAIMDALYRGYSLKQNLKREIKCPN